MRSFVQRDCFKTEFRALGAWLFEKNGIKPFDFRGEVNTLFEFVRDGVRYQRDPVSTETVAGAGYTLAAGFGDCDDKAVLLATLAAACGFLPVFIVASRDGQEFEHVWVRIGIFETDGSMSWVDCDPCSQDEIGWTPAKNYPELVLCGFPCFEESGGLGFDPTGVIGVGASIIGNVVGQITQNQRTRQMDERTRDSIFEEFMAQLGYLKKDLEANRINPFQAERTAETLARQYKSQLFASVTTESVRRSIANKQANGGPSQQERVEGLAKEIADAARAKQTATAPGNSQTGSAPSTGGGILSGSISIPGLGSIPTAWILIGIGLVLVIKK